MTIKTIFFSGYPQMPIDPPLPVFPQKVDEFLKQVDQETDPIAAWRSQVMSGLDEKSSYWEFAQKILQLVVAVNKSKIARFCPKEIFEICLIGEQKLHQASVRGAAYHLKKDKNSLSHSLLIDPPSKTFTILLQRKGLLKCKGNSGKVTSGIEVKVASATCCHVAVKVNHDNKEPFSESEIRHCTTFGGLRTVVQYVKGDSDIQKCMFTTEAYPAGDLTKLPNCTHEQARQILRGLSEEIDTMHRQGVVHYDIKRSNVLVKYEPEGLKVKLCDYGLAFDQEDQWSTGIYGTALWSAFEIWAVREWSSLEIWEKMSLTHETTQEECMAHDMYAVGCLAYLLLTRTDEQEWIDILNDLWVLAKGRNIAAVKMEERKPLLAKLKQAHADLFQRLGFEALDKKQKAGEKLSDSELLSYLVCRLMDVSPKTRMKASELRKVLF